MSFQFTNYKHLVNKFAKGKELRGSCQRNALVYQAQRDSFRLQISQPAKTSIGKPQQGQLSQKQCIGNYENHQT